ncbi:DUF2637 domain-containing protein [Streptomyces niveiscabiei]|uniref:DUF2637 domain-containing protein n=1 Tax=Streptomyces niveiscabiei TaxID=164115 RepID=UPI0006EB38F5|nr:DUF2637 domain-containing protein [Streptomyces niveiscabiei]
MPGWVQTLLGIVTLFGMGVVATVGFASSYDTLQEAAVTRGFSKNLSYWVPVGIDGAIIAFLALDLYLTARRIPWPLLRFAAHGMTLATVVLNASGQRTRDAVGMFWHGLMPVLFIVGVEAVRKLIVHAARLADGQISDRIPLHRWILAPTTTARLYRRMRLANVRSYPEMIRREQDLDGYRIWLTQELGDDLTGATQVQRLPMTLAPKGFTVDEALALPSRWAAAAAERERQAAERTALQEAEAAERAADLTIRKAKAAGRVEAAQHRITAQTNAAQAEAQATAAQAQAGAEAARVRAERLKAEAERAVQAEAEALRSVDHAALLLKAAEAEKQAEKAAADAEAERARAQAERTKSLRLEAEAESERLRATEARQRAAVLEAEAQTADGWARLTPRERRARRVARMIVAAGGNDRTLDVVSLAEIEADLGVGRTTAGELRQEAGQLLAGGYDPQVDYEPAGWR